MPKTRTPRDQWLEENHPALYYTILGFDGDGKALRWLKNNTTTLYQLCRAVTGGTATEAAVRDCDPVERDLLLEAMDREELLERLRKHHPEVHMLFEAGKGNAAARRRLSRQKPGLTQFADLLKQWRQAKTTDVKEETFREGTAADVGQLVGEMHLSKKEYEKAAQAFTRALENQPTADAYEGRAKAYRGLADEDDRQAEIMRRRGFTLIEVLVIIGIIGMAVALLLDAV